ncbi:hypothetical protein NDI52_14165 [Leptolyngbya sp. PL-A3]|uniref:hypothetical protein n=1 Tax=Leptolyngbya sp. PL-A3 TaxID=2933911 RepID=UPI003297875D
MTVPRKYQPIKPATISEYLARRNDGEGNDSMTPENDKLVTKIPVDDSANVTFRQIGEWLDEKPNTVGARYFPKVVMAHEGLKGYPALQSAPGKPTGYAAKCIAEYLELNKDFEGFVTLLKSRYSEGSKPVDDNVIHPELVDDDTQDDTPPASGMSDRRDIAGKLALRKEQSEDDTDGVMSELALTIQQFKEQDKDFFGSEEERLYEEAYQRKLAELGKGLKRRMIERKAELDAERDFKELMEES